VLKELLRSEWPQPVLVTVVSQKRRGSRATARATWSRAIGGLRDTPSAQRSHVNRTPRFRPLYRNGHIARIWQSTWAARPCCGLARFASSSRPQRPTSPLSSSKRPFDPFAASVVIAEPRESSEHRRLTPRHLPVRRRANWPFLELRVSASRAPLGPGTASLAGRQTAATVKCRIR
jgi:hypothetical protein